MINLYANKSFKKMGCKWTGSQWVAPELAQDEFNALYEKYYTDLIVIEVTHTPENNHIYGGDFGYSHARVIAGYVVASANGRDSGARLADGVAVIKGCFKSGGSVKNYICDYSENLTFRVKVSRNLLSEIDEEVEENRYIYKIVGDNNQDELLKQREILLNKLKEIDDKLNNLQ